MGELFVVGNVFHLEKNSGNRNNKLFVCRNSYSLQQKMSGSQIVTVYCGKLRPLITACDRTG
jgi:hypothetical protein